MNKLAINPMQIEKKNKGSQYFFSGILNFQKGIKKIKTIPILIDAMRIGGTELFKASLAIGKALPWVAIMKSKINKCFKGNLLSN